MTLAPESFFIHYGPLGSGNCLGKLFQTAWKKNLAFVGGMDVFFKLAVVCWGSLAPGTKRI
jgi:hypothetical protein